MGPTVGAVTLPVVGALLTEVAHDEVLLDGRVVENCSGGELCHVAGERDGIRVGARTRGTARVRRGAARWRAVVPAVVGGVDVDRGVRRRARRDAEREGKNTGEDHEKAGEKMGFAAKDLHARPPFDRSSSPATRARATSLAAGLRGAEWGGVEPTVGKR